MEPVAGPPPPTNHKVMRAACHPPGPRRNTAVCVGGAQSVGTWNQEDSVDRLDDLRQSPAFPSNCGFFLWRNKK